MNKKERHKQRKYRLFITGFGIFALVLSLVMLVLNAPHKIAGYPDNMTPNRVAEQSDIQYNDTDVPIDADISLDAKLDHDAPSVAIIIDDFGPPGTAFLLDEFLSLPGELTWAIIPGNLKSGWISAQAMEADQEVFIHMPMQPGENVAMKERDMLLVGMHEEDVKAALSRALVDVPNAVGLNNHMGSSATKDSSLMQILADELKSHGLKFIDSQTVPRSVAHGIMRNNGVQSLRRDVFLDNQRDTLAIERQFDELISIATRRGWAIGIGHARKQTMQVLAKLIPEQLDKGVRFVSVRILMNMIYAPETADDQIQLAADE
ncbi:divergent polysaccharide deacetylase family protein [Calditrichota bacterium]